MKLKIKNVLCAALAVLITLASAAPALAAGGYPDVPAGAWYESYLSDLTASGAVSGYPDGRFGPDDSVKLGEALKLVFLAAGYDKQAPANSHWASGYLALAAKMEMLTGDEALDEPATRLSVGQLAAQALGFVKSANASPFSDCEDGYVVSLYDHGVITGIEEGGGLVYKPSATITRAEVCAVIRRMMNDDIHDGMFQYGSYWIDVEQNVPVSAWSSSSHLVKGVDVSYYQGEIDWSAVKAGGVDFAILRLGYRGYGSGKLMLDEQFLSYIKGATAAGINVGVYFFSQAVSVKEALEEADMVLEYIKDYDVSFPVCYDWEPIFNDEARTDDISRRTLTDCAIAFCDRVKQAGYTPMIYFTKWMGYTLYDLSRLTDYEFWFAQYSTAPTCYYDLDMWQYTSSGSVPGISGRVDMNWSSKDYAA